MKFKIFIVSVLFACIVLPSINHAQNKVVVIPLMEDSSLEPYAPVADTHPPSSSYSLGTNYIRDNVTGLIWQQMDNNTAYDWYGAMNYCHNDPILDGKSDWRLPSVGELMSIVHYGYASPAINSVVFTGTNSDHYWTATNRASSGTDAWRVNFNYGHATDDSRSEFKYVRCVRGKFIRDHIFQNNGNGTVTDLATGLTWQKEDDNDVKTWSEADTYCQGLSLAGGGWRLPTIKELRSIVDDRMNNPVIDSDIFPGTNSSGYWSASNYADNSVYAWGVNFYNGYFLSINKSVNLNVRCVR